MQTGEVHLFELLTIIIITNIHFISCDVISRIDLKSLKAFWEKPLPQDFVTNSLIKVPVQFQSEMNVINMHNLTCGLPLREDLFERRQTDLHTTASKTVLLASEFPLSTKTSHWIETFRCVRGEGEKIMVIWLDNEYCLLKFPSEEACEKAYMMWEEAKGE